MTDTGSNVKVAVRVRPFNTREITQKTANCISMTGNQTIIVDPTTGKENKFSYDYSYWSHNDAQEFASQETVFQDLGVLVLENAWQGYNTSIFAYGQTGSGKSYSMVGSIEDKGIIPRVCEEMFVRIEKDETAAYQVEVSMVEIYNEKVRDLFNPTNPLNKAEGLKVREHPTLGPYIEGLESVTVHNFKDIEDLMAEGNRMRTIAKTDMNATSSRAHTIFQIILKQTSTTQLSDGDSLFSEKSSRINLIDLAGSERVSKTNATGQRLKEGSCINVSLTTLGNVINKLAEASNDSSKNVFVPYRDSILTWLLKDSLGGNSKTIMIATISPSDFNYNESLSTLRYANRAKNIKNKATVNEDANIAIIRDLKEEIERLKILLAQHENGETMVHNEKEKIRLMEELEESRAIIEQLQRTPDQKERRAEELSEIRKSLIRDAGFTPITVQEDIPHFFNLNEDPMLNGLLIHFFKNGETRIGKQQGVNDVVLGGSMIHDQHCIVTRDEQVTLTPLTDAFVFRNGKRMVDAFELVHGDRIILGGNHVFRFSDLASDSEEKQGESNDIDWQFAHIELVEQQGINEILMRKEQEWEEEWKSTKLKQLEIAFEQEKHQLLENLREQVRSELRKQQEELDRQTLEIEKQRVQAHQQIELEKAQLQLASKPVVRVEEVVQNSQTSQKTNTPFSIDQPSETSGTESSPRVTQKSELLLNTNAKKHDSMIVYEHEIEEIHSRHGSLARPLSTKVAPPPSPGFKKVFQAIRGKKKGSGKHLDKQLIRTLPLIKEANEICRLVQPNIRFDMKILIDSDAVACLRVHCYNSQTFGQEFLDMYDFEGELHSLREEYASRQQNKGKRMPYMQEAAHA